MAKTYWDDLEVGTVLWGDTVTVDPNEMLDYARLNDPQPFHLDEAAAQETPFGGLIASGGYTVTLWYRSAITVLTKLSFLGGFEWTIKLPAPVRPNDQLRVKTEIVEKRRSSKGGRGYVTTHQQILNQDDVIVFICDATWILATKE